MEIQGNMVYKIFGLSFRLLAFYFTFLIIKSIYQAISPFSAHNKGEIINYGAEHIQQRFRDLQNISPGFNYFVQTMYQVIAQVLLTMKIRYNIAVAILTGISMAFGLFSALLVFADLLLELGMGVVEKFAELSSDGEEKRPENIAEWSLDGKGKRRRKIAGGSSNGGNKRPKKAAFPKMPVSSVSSRW